MDLYRSTFGALLLLNSIILLRSYRAKTGTFTTTPSNSEKVEHRGREDDDSARVRRLKWQFLPVFLLVNGADWLQGPYIYPIYKGMLALLLLLLSSPPADPDPQMKRDSPRTRSPCCSWWDSSPAVSRPRLRCWVMLISPKRAA